MSETKFIDGLYVDAPREGAPAFVKGRISIKASQLCQFLKKAADNGELNNGYLNIDVLEAKSGKWYAKVNDYKKPEQAAPAQPPAAHGAHTGEDFDDSQIPF